MRKDKENTKETSTAFKEDALIVESAKIASSKAIRSSTAMGITIKVIKDNKIIEINPDKSVKVIRIISKPQLDTSSLKKGMVLERK
ncbi:MAG TPA: hypothetical protein VLZ11_09050 [Flavobacterium sp.]|nr:hypothetical protein [Flavobacterium sp.]